MRAAEAVFHFEPLCTGARGSCAGRHEEDSRLRPHGPDKIAGGTGPQVRLIWPVGS